MSASRLVALDGTFNFRDLGGYPTIDGGFTSWGRVYRSDGLQALTASDVAELRRRRLSTVVDLRTTAEVERWGRGPLAGEGIGYEHLSIIREEAGESLAAPDTDDLAERYLWYLQIGRTAVLRALELVAEASRLPLVFHCVAGKDRTGVLAALLLDSAGVEQPAIVADYALTGERLGPILDRLASRAAPGELQSVPASRLAVDASTMQRFLTRLHERFGGAAGWARSAGMDPSAVARLRTVLAG